MRSAVKAAAIAAVCVSVLWSAGCDRTDDTVRPDCALEGGLCVTNTSSGPIGLMASPAPVRPMREVVFKVGAGEYTGPEPVKLDFTMPGMNMGINRYMLDALGGGVFSVKAVLPRCPGGGTIWRAAVLDAEGRELGAFVFEVR